MCARERERGYMYIYDRYPGCWVEAKKGWVNLLVRSTVAYNQSYVPVHTKYSVRTLGVLNTKVAGLPVSHVQYHLSAPRYIRYMPFGSFRLLFRDT
jgi:hypothetical protein